MDTKTVNTIIAFLNAGYSADEIAEIAFKEEENLQEAAKMKTITKAREGVKLAFNEYNKALDYPETMPDEFWDAIFDMYEEGVETSMKAKEADIEDILKWLDKPLNDKDEMRS